MLTLTLLSAIVSFLDDLSLRHGLRVWCTESGDWSYAWAGEDVYYHSFPGLGSCLVHAIASRLA